MNEADRIRLMHMLVAAREVLSFAEGRTRSDLTRNRMHAAPEIPWARLAVMRNRVIHAYFDIDEVIVWDTTVLDLPPLVMILAKLVAAEG